MNIGNRPRPHRQAFHLVRHKRAHVSRCSTNAVVGGLFRSILQACKTEMLPTVTRNNWKRICQVGRNLAQPRARYAQLSVVQQKPHWVVRSESVETIGTTTSANGYRTRRRQLTRESCKPERERTRNGIDWRGTGRYRSSSVRSASKKNETASRCSSCSRPTKRGNSTRR